MTTPKLTPAQLAVMRLLVKGAYAECWREVWYIGRNKVTRQIHALIDKEFAKSSMSGTTLIAKATDAARALLAEIDGKDKPDA